MDGRLKDEPSPFALRPALSDGRPPSKQTRAQAGRQSHLPAGRPAAFLSSFIPVRPARAPISINDNLELALVCDGSRAASQKSLARPRTAHLAATKRGRMFQSHPPGPARRAPSNYRIVCARTRARTRVRVRVRTHSRAANLPWRHPSAGQANESAASLTGARGATNNRPPGARLFSLSALHFPAPVQVHRHARLSPTSRPLCGPAAHFAWPRRPLFATSRAAIRMSDGSLGRRVTFAPGARKRDGCFVVAPHERRPPPPRETLP